MLINVTSKSEGMRLLNVGETMLWVPEAATLQTDGKHLHSTAKAIGIKITVGKSLLVAEGYSTKVVFQVERIA